MAAIDWAIVAVYILFVLAIGVLAARRTKSGTDFFLAGRSLPAWVCGLAFISANLGATEVIGMGASGAKYGMATAHFYWIGAIPAMVFVGVLMMPFYYGSRARSAPEYLRLRFDEKTRGFNAISFALMTVLASGISMYALAKLIGVLHLLDAPLAGLGLSHAWAFHVAVLISALVVLVYIYAGGLKGAIYNEVLQFFLIVAGFAPLVWLGLRAVGGWHGLQASLTPDYLHAWAGMTDPHKNRLGVEWIGLSMGLGFVLSFGYWCTDFLIVQRAMAADNMDSARRTPLIAASLKMFFPFLLIVPGLVAMALTAAPTPAAPAGPGVSAAAHAASAAPLIPQKIDGATGRPAVDSNGQPLLDYDLATPSLLLRFFPAGLLGLGVTALLASFMSGMAGNVTAFNTVWTYDIYQAYIRREASDAHYLHVGRLATLVGVLLSVGAAYLANGFNNIMDLIQLIFAFVNAPVLATFLCGMFWKRATGHGAFSGLAAGTVAAALHHGLTLPDGDLPGIKGGWIGVLHAYPSEMAQNFWTAIFSFSTCFVVTVLVSFATLAPDEANLVGLVRSMTPRPADDSYVWWRRPAVLGGVVLVGAVILNVIFR
ncbi:MAG: Na+/galactose cotransporter [Phenylobacterium sp.]|nr:MAG: Na+/galactose cotransporter [Phenylobacterium sp.]